MSDEHDSWFKSAFGVDLGEAATKIKTEASAFAGEAASTAGQVVRSVQGAVEGGVDGVTSGIAGAVAKAAAGVSGAAGAVAKKVAGALAPAGAPAGGAGAGSFPLSGSVGRGGKNAPSDVSAVQSALGVGVDGQCGPQTISAIEAFQRTRGQAKPDGRVDAGGATERALAGASPLKSPAAAPAPAPGSGGGPDSSGSLFDRAVQGAKDLAGGLGDLGGGLSPGGGSTPIDLADARSDFSLGGLKLSLDNLSDEQVAEAHRFLAGHGFAAAHIRGSGAVFEDYDPVLDGRPTNIPDIRRALLGEIKPRPLQNPAEGLKTLVEQRYGQLVSTAMKDAAERAAAIVRAGAKAPPTVSREDAAKDLTAFFERVLAAQGGQDLRVTDPVRAAGQAVARGLPGADTGVATLLQGKSLPGKPAALAAAIARLLPPTIPRSNVEALDRIPIKESTSNQPQSLSALIGAALSKDLERIIKILPKSFQDSIRKGAADAVAAGVVAIVGRALADSPLDETARKEVKAIVEAALKQKANEPPLDRKQSTDGSPDAKDRPPPPTFPEAPGEEILKSPEVDLPEGLPNGPSARPNP